MNHSRTTPATNSEEPTPSSAPDSDHRPVCVVPGAGYEKVEPWFDIVRLEQEILTFWQESDAFSTLVKKNKGNTPFSFIDGPITANNPMGVHHAWGRSLKDAYQRFWAMNGRELRYQNGFDCQGLWVEVEVEKAHHLNSKKDVEAFGIDRFVETCKERVRKYSKIQTQQSIRLGMWMDWDNSYYTMSEANNYAIWGFLKRCADRGKIYRGTDVMPWSGRSGSAYSQMEIIEGRKMVAHTAPFVRFPLRDRAGENLLIWTTTPWTLTSNVAAAVNIDLEYAKIRDKRSGELYYACAENLHYQRLERQFREKKEWIPGVPKLKTIAQLFNERGGFDIEGSVRGKDLIGLAYRGPFDELEAQGIAGGFPFTDATVAAAARDAHRIIDGGRDSHGNPIVVAGEGTGIVHIAPGCGDIDHTLGTKLGLPKLAPLDESAKFLDKFGALSGQLATDPKTIEAVLRNLKEKDLLIATERYPHVYPHCWRTGDELVFRLVDEWYIKMDWREEIKRSAATATWIPGWGKERELEWLSNMRDWMISKKRYWGLALPIWVCGSCDHFEVIGSREELKERAVSGWDDFEGHSPHRPYVDGIRIACTACGGEGRRVSDVGNPWLDAGIVPYSTLRYGEDPNYWKKWFPADLVLESFPGQFRNWFYALLSMSTMLSGKAPFKTLVGHALMRDESGDEMHKSKGNAIWFDDAAQTWGADVMRWLFAGHEPSSNLNFSEKKIREVRGKFINTLWNTYAFYLNYARLESFSPDSSDESASDALPYLERPDFDRWILTEAQDTIARCREAFENHDIRTATRAIEAFVDDLSGWYVRHNRRRFWKSDERVDLHTALDTLYTCIDSIIRLAAPIIPFVCEAIYQNLVRAVDTSAPTSIHHCDYPSPHEALCDRPLTEDMRAIKRLNSLALAAREAKKIKIRQPLACLTLSPANEQQAGAAQRFISMLRDDLNVKEVRLIAPSTPSPLTYRLKPNFKTLGARLGPKMKACAAAISANSSALIEKWREGTESFPLLLDGETITLTREDLLLESAAPDHLSVVEDHGIWVAFDTRIDEALRIEGLMRDLLRRIQLLRKESGFEIEDRIHLLWESERPDVARIFNEWGEHLADELLCRSLKRAPDPLNTSARSDNEECRQESAADGKRVSATFAFADGDLTIDLERA